MREIRYSGETDTPTGGPEITPRSLTEIAAREVREAKREDISAGRTDLRDIPSFAGFRDDEPVKETPLGNTIHLTWKDGSTGHIFLDGEGTHVSGDRWSPGRVDGFQCGETWNVDGSRIREIVHPDGLHVMQHSNGLQVTLLPGQTDGSQSQEMVRPDGSWVREINYPDGRQVMEYSDEPYRQVTVNPVNGTQVAKYTDGSQITLLPAHYDGTRIRETVHPDGTSIQETVNTADEATQEPWKVRPYNAISLFKEV